MTFPLYGLKTLLWENVCIDLVGLADVKDDRKSKTL
jgi:hypothetical protein